MRGWRFKLGARLWRQATPSARVTRSQSHVHGRSLLRHAKIFVGMGVLQAQGKNRTSLRCFTRYDWIDILVPDPDKQRRPRARNTLAWVNRAREACVAIQLLSCCHGFSAEENPVFWKRLIDHRDDHTAARSSKRTPSQVNDAHGFFIGERFPRFRLMIADNDMYKRIPPSDSDDEAGEDESFNSVSDWLARVVQVFCGLDDGFQVSVRRSSSSTRSLVDQLVDRVISIRFLGASIEIGLHLEEIYRVRKLAVNTYDQHMGFAKHNSRCGNAAVFQQGYKFFPQAFLVGLSFNNSKSFVEERQVEELTEATRQRLRRRSWLWARMGDQGRNLSASSCATQLGFNGRSATRHERLHGQRRLRYPIASRSLQSREAPRSEGHSTVSSSEFKSIACTFPSLTQL